MYVDVISVNSSIPLLNWEKCSRMSTFPKICKNNLVKRKSYAKLVLPVFIYIKCLQMFLSPFCSEMFQFEDTMYHKKASHQSNIGTCQSEEQAKTI